MFPPIFRQKSKRPFNRYAINRLINEIQNRGCLVGFHPEGTRNKNPDPYQFLPARPGIGEVIAKSPQTKTLPIFIHGVTSNFFTELGRNWFKASKFPIHVWLGQPVLFEQENSKPNHLLIAQKCMSKISDLATKHKETFKTQA